MASIQTELAFAVRKSSRIRNKVITQDENSITEPSPRTKKSTKRQLLVKPEKTTDKSSTPTRQRKSKPKNSQHTPTKVNNENDIVSACVNHVQRTPVKSDSPLKRLLLTPGKQSRISQIILGSPSKDVRIPLSPRSMNQIVTQPLGSPKAGITRKLQFEKQSSSPTKRHSDEENCPTPQSPTKKKKESLKVSRSIFSDSENVLSPLRLARQNVACYSKAKIALATSTPEDIVGREKESNQIKIFLSKNLFKKSAASLYISGAPGTGKTAVLSHIINDLQESKRCKVVYVNCMSFRNSHAIYNKVYSELTGKEQSLSVKDATKQLEKIFTSQGSMVTMILDEVDQLDSKNQEVLYTMFEWPALEQSRLLLIGIANALDLTDRILPRLQARPNCKPQLLHFTPYSKDQIVKVLQHRLSKVEVSGHCVLELSAVQFCARKVAAVAGDMRKALDVCRRAVETVEADVRKQQILQTADTPVVPKKINIAHVSKIVNEVYGTRVTASCSEQQTIPLQQKLAICTLLLMLKVNAKAKEVTVGKLHEKYSKVCKRQQVAGVDQGEFLSMCALIESRGIMAVKRTKDARSSKVTLKLDEKELQSALEDKILLADILQKGLP